MQQKLVATTSLILGVAILIPLVGGVVGAESVPVRFVLELNGLGIEEVGELASGLGIRVTGYSAALGFAVLDGPMKMPLTDISSLAMQKGFGSVRADQRVRTEYTPNDPRFATDQWGPQKIRAPLAWDLTRGSSAVVIAVIDTGVDYQHLDLAANMWTSPTGSHGRDFVSDDDDPMDDMANTYHGTHVAGTVAAVIGNGVGIAGMANVKVMAIKVLDSSGWGWSSDVALGMQWAVDNGADCLSLSLGGGADSSEEAAVKYAIDHNVAVVAAAGNNDGELSYPAAYPDVIAVGATDTSDARAWFSNHGPNLDVMAPGMGIYSTMAGNNYQSLSGTSMATPHVSGVVALMLSRAPGLTPAQVAVYLEQTAVDLGDTGRDDYFGWGRIDAYAAVNAVSGADTVPPSVSITSPISGQVFTNPVVSITGMASDDRSLASVDVRTAGSAWHGASGMSSWSSTLTLVAGLNTLEARATDGAGNTAVASVGVTYVPPDVTPPAVAIASPTADPSWTTSSTPLLVAGSASDNVAVTAVSWSNAATGGSGATSGTVSWSATIPLVLGNNLITVTAQDAAGNAGTDVLAVLYETPDATPPTVAIASPADGAVLASPTVAVSGTATDPGPPSSGLNRVEVRVNSGAWVPAAGTALWTATVVLLPGLNLIEARAADAAGNTATVAVSVTYDPGHTNEPLPTSSRPEITIESPHNKARVSGAVLVEGTARNYSSVKVRVDDGEWQLVAVSGSEWYFLWDSEGIRPGAHLVEARACSSQQCSSTALVLLVERREEGNNTLWLVLFIVALVAAGGIIGLHMLKSSQLRRARA